MYFSVYDLFYSFSNSGGARLGGLRLFQPFFTEFGLDGRDMIFFLVWRKTQRTSKFAFVIVPFNEQSMDMRMWMWKIS
jgi:hypothetical protein